LWFSYEGVNIYLYGVSIVKLRCKYFELNTDDELNWKDYIQG